MGATLADCEINNLEVREVTVDERRLEQLIPGRVLLRLCPLSWRPKN